MFARLFHHVTAVDVSAEMIERARANLQGTGNITLILGDGATLASVADQSLDFAFSYIVFQHIPSLDVISSYCREVSRVLTPGSLFKFQVQGAVFERENGPDTWQGVTVTEVDAAHLADENGFTIERTSGAGTQYYWLWFRKP
jgi:ubiquinone/menaquinone biosynthesis C-methylase UbiE